MKIIGRHLLMIVFVAGCASLCFAQVDKPSFELPAFPVENDPSEWRVFSSTEAGFSISMPGIPEHKSLLINPGLINYESYGLRTTSAGYLVTFSDVPVYSERPELIRKGLDESRDRLLSNNAGMKLLSEKEVILNGIPAREWLYEDLGLISRQRTILVKDRLYYLIVITSPAVAFTSGIPNASPHDQTEFYKTTAEKFFDSFVAMTRQEISGRLIDTTQAPSVDSTVKVESGTAPEGEVDIMMRKERAAKTVVVSGGMLDGKAISKPVPAYPAIAKTARASGKVTVRVMFDEEGNVIAAQAQSGHPLLRASAVQAARKARFVPIRLSNKPVKVMGTITYNFVL